MENKIDVESIVRQFAFQKFEALGVLVVLGMALINMAKGNWPLLISAQAVPFYVFLLMSWSTWYGSLRAESECAFSGSYAKGYAIDAASAGLTLFVCGAAILAKAYFPELKLWGKIGAIAAVIVIFLIKNSDYSRAKRWVRQEERDGTFNHDDPATEFSPLNGFRGIFQLGVWIYAVVYMFI